MMQIKIFCKKCKKPNIVSVHEKDFQEYQQGSDRLIQNIFPYLKSSERELFITQLCGNCWDEMWKEKE